MAISFHLQSLLENHQSHLPPKGAKGEEVNKMTRFRNLRFPVNNFLLQIHSTEKIREIHRNISKHYKIVQFDETTTLSPSLKG